MRHLRNCVLLVFAVAVSASGEWTRQLITPKGSRVDVPMPHPLEYFTRDPFLRDDGNDFCIRCTAEEKATIHLTEKSDSKVEPIGNLAGYNLFDIFYYFDDSPKIAWKSILAEVTPGQFIEIYYLQPTIAEIGPSFLQPTGGEILLATRDRIPGTGAFNYEAYWWFDREGPIHVDLRPIGEAAASILPKNTGIWKGYGLDWNSLSYSVAVWKEGDPNGGPTGGQVDIKFKVVCGKIEVTDKRYTPPADLQK